MFSIAPAELFIILLIFASLAGPVWGIIDAAHRSNEIFRAAGHSKNLWIALQVLFVPLGSLLYFLIARPSLKRESAKSLPPPKGDGGLVWY